MSTTVTVKVGFGDSRKRRQACVSKAARVQEQFVQARQALLQKTGSGMLMRVAFHFIADSHLLATLGPTTESSWFASHTAFPQQANDSPTQIQ